MGGQKTEESLGPHCEREGESDYEICFRHWGTNGSCNHGVDESLEMEHMRRREKSVMFIYS